jgi:MFS family permease
MSTNEGKPAGGGGAPAQGGWNAGPQLPTAKHAWPVLFVIFLMSMSIAMTWFAVTAIKSSFAAAYGAKTMASFGRLMQFVSYGAFIGAIIAAPLAEKANVKVTFICAGLCSLLGTIIAALPGNSLSVLLTGRFILGVGLGLCAVTSPTAIGIWFPLKTRGLATSIWAMWVPVGMLIVMNSANPIISSFAGMSTAAFMAVLNPTTPADKVAALQQAAAPGFHGLFIVLAVVLAVALVLLIIVYRAPREGESDATIRSKPPLKVALPHLLKPNLLAVAITWMAYNIINQCNSSYIVAFMQAGYGFSQGTASFLGSLASASSILAVIFGFISDRLKLEKKYLLIVIATASVTVGMFFGFKPADVSTAAGMARFIAYLVFMFIGNAGLAACVRPYVPILVGKGGVTAIGYAFTAVTLIQYIGQMIAEPFGRLVDSLGGATGAFQSGTVTDQAILAATGNAFGTASWILVAAGVIGFLFSFGLKIKVKENVMQQ